jgi:dehydrogenase/reductase SDR family protein 7B
LQNQDGIEMEIKDRIVWITGASSGIGEQLAYLFDRAGARVILSSNEAEQLERVRGNCQGDAEVLPLDLSDAADLAEKARQVLARHGRVDFLVNNGGITQRSYVKDTKMSIYRRVMEIDFFGQVALTLAVLPSMLERKSGHIVVTSSVAGKIGAPLRSAYSAAKHALHGFFDTLRAETHRDNIKVTIVCPTAVTTNISLHALDGEGKSYGKMSKHLEKGISPTAAAKKIMKAVMKQKEEVIVGADMLMVAVYLKRLVPGLFSKILRNTKTD